jgi:CO dehydrogenase/acetyl-CoA synthase epsilon subunit
LKRLEKRVKTGKLTKEHINKELSGEVNITINYNKFEADSAWDGLKGYVTNTHLSQRFTVKTFDFKNIPLFLPDV